MSNPLFDINGGFCGTEFRDPGYFGIERYKVEMKNKLEGIFLES